MINKRAVLLGVIFSLVYVQPVQAEHPICGQNITGVTLGSTIEEADIALKAKNLRDVTCSQRMKMPCEKYREQTAKYATNANARLEKLDDLMVMVHRDRTTKNVSGVVSVTRISAPETFHQTGEEPSWDGWSHASLIKSKINEFCKSPAPEGLTIGCKYRGGVQITVLVGDTRAKECKYTFEARYVGQRGPTPPDHTIRETLTKN